MIVSTARHEFFGLSVVEAVAAGAYPLLPNRLAYPELLAAADDRAAAEAFLYDGDAEALTERLAALCRRIDSGNLWQGDRQAAARRVARFTWDRIAPALDEAIEAVGRR